jgi:hypothetical protein
MGRAFILPNGKIVGRSEKQCDNNAVPGMNGFAGGTTESGGYFADDGVAGFGAMFSMNL